MSFPKITSVYAVLLVILGVGGYALTGGVSLTALIPAAFGVLLLACGLAAVKPSWRRHAMHAALLLALIAFAGSVSGVPAAWSVVTGGEVERPEAAVARAAMALLSLVYLILGVKSFIDARRARTS